MAAERDAARVAAEEEARRREAAREAARVAAEEQARRFEAEREAARLAAEEEARRLEAAREAARLAAQAEAEAARRAAEEAAARRAREAERVATEQRAAAQASTPAIAFEPGRNLDDEIAAYERGLGEAPQPAAPAGAPTWPVPGAMPEAFEPHWPDVSVAMAADGFAPQPADGAAGPARAAKAPIGPGAHLPAVSQPAAPLAARACPSCGLSLSASARFCRRCGTAQQAAV
jgi:hypothetical protein